MGLPQIGKSKVKAITERKQVLPSYSKARGRGADAAGGAGELTFSWDDGNQKLPAAPTFNVLYVQTPRIGVMQAPWFRAFTGTCQEAADMVKPLLRLGLRETSLYDKCPYYDPEFSKSPSAPLIMLRRTREVVNAARDGSLYQPCEKKIPKGHVYITDFPNATTVLFLNLGAYFLITRQSKKLSSGG
ncbi:MAG: hypothetical protein J3K34DRAFT_434964 [Monoraphidium minutum]|nr:MAG: hypothetical protein J3K34DRAFT_434964 [Monoraphidium minutum]